MSRQPISSATSIGLPKPLSRQTVILKGIDLGILEASFVVPIDSPLGGALSIIARYCMVVASSKEDT